MAWGSIFYRLVSLSDNICQNTWSKLTKVNTNFRNFPLRYKNSYLGQTDYANIVPHGTCNWFEIWLAFNRTKHECLADQRS
jgi:hypothetical protein